MARGAVRLNARAHDVEVDAARELGELDKIAGAANAAVAEEVAAAELATHNPEAWREASEWTVDALSAMLVPAWQLDDAARSRLSTSLTRVLDHYLPGAVHGIDNWHPLVQLGAACAMVVASHGFDFKRLAFKPTHPSTAELERRAAAERAADQQLRELHGEDQTAGRDGVLSDGHDPVRKNGSGFSIGGSSD